MRNKILKKSKKNQKQLNATYLKGLLTQIV